MITLQRFSEDNPPTVAQLNVYFESMASAINALSGQQIIQFLGPSETSGLYAALAGADFTGAISATKATLGSPLAPVPTFTIGETAPDLGADPDTTFFVPRLWYQPSSCGWFVWHIEGDVGQWVELPL